MSTQSLDAIAENWYSRLNRLKDYSQRDDISLEKRQQCEKLIWIMINRMMKVTPLYIQARLDATKSLRGFPVGGVTFKS